MDGLRDELIEQYQLLLKPSLESSIESMQGLKSRKENALSGDQPAEDEALRNLQLAYTLDRFVGETESMVRAFITKELAEWALSNESGLEAGWRFQLANVESVLVLAIQMEDAKTSKKLRQVAAQRFCQSVDEIVDGDGWVLAEYVEQFWGLIASWSRCFALLNDAGTSIPEKTIRQLEWVARQFIRTMRPDGTQMLGDVTAANLDKKFQDAILAMTSDRLDRKLLRLRDPSLETKQKDGVHSHLHDGYGFSEWAGFGVFQSGWATQSPRLAIADHKECVNIELVNSKPLLSGQSDWEIKHDGKVLNRLSSERDINLYHTDKDVEFLELEYKLDGDVTLQRQFLLAREDQFLLVADVVLTEADGLIEYQGRWDLGPGIEVLHESETREVYLRSDEIHSLVLPLGLGEWQADRSPGGLVCEENQLRLNMSAQGRALYAPLFFDLSPHRSRQPRTWRHLTVAEELEILSKDQAVAYRVQIGQQQWILYRSLSGSQNRTFFGENQICEFYLARTDAESVAEELLQLE